MSDPYRLGPALLHISEDSSAHAPETFRSALLRALDSRSRVAVALTCKAGLRWLLTEWMDSAALQLAVRPSSAAVPDVRLLCRMLRARLWLSVRGDLPASLTLVQQGQGISARVDATAGLAALCLVGRRAFPDLRLSLQTQHIPAFLLQLVGSVFRGLTTLSIGRDTDSDSGSTAQLPPPATLRALRHLTIHRICEDSQAALWTSVAPYLQQLTSLSIGEQPYVALSRPHLSTLFAAPAASPSTTLTHFSLADTLEPWLASLLCEHLPALGTLTVASVCSRERDTDKPVPAVCPWHTLVISQPWHTSWQSSRGFFAAWLPLPASGRLVVDVSGKAQGAARLELDALTFDKLRSIELHGCRELTISTEGLNFGHGTPALWAALPHLAPHASSDIELVLELFEMSAEFAALLHDLWAQGWTNMSLTEAVWDETDVATPFPPLRKLVLFIDDGYQIDEARLADMQQCVTSAEVVRGWWKEGYLPSPDTHLPWRTTKLTGLELSTLLHLAERLPGMSWDLGELTCNITDQQVESGEYLDLAKRLRPVRFTRVGNVQLECRHYLDDRGYIAGQVADQPGVLRASLIVAKALTCPVDTLSLEIGQLTPALVAEFCHLPAWHTELCFGLETDQRHKLESLLAVAKAATLIPSTYQSLYVSLGECREEEVLAFVSALPRRTRDAPLTIHLPEWQEQQAAVACIRDMVAENGRLFPHMTIA